MSQLFLQLDSSVIVGKGISERSSVPAENTWHP